MDRRTREEKEYNQQAYADKKHKRNALVETLTEEQHTTLRGLCADRHYMHVNGEKEIWGEGSDNSRTYQLIGGVMSDSEINQYLVDAELSKINFIDYDDCDNIETYDCDCDTDEEREDAKWEARAEISRIIEHNDKLICEYLQKIDAEHGTEYTPSGFSRQM